MSASQPFTFGMQLKRYRRATGLSQEQLAERAGYSVAYVSALERDARRPLAATATALADALSLGAPERAALLGRVAGGTGARRGQPPVVPTEPLVGRRGELIRLGRHLAGEGPPLLLLAGEPGIGKSRLLQEAAGRAGAGGWTVLAGGCTRRAGQEPYAPLLGALAEWVRGRPPAALRHDLEGCAWLARLLPELAEETLVPAPAWTLPPEQERRLMYAAAGRLLANVAGPAGTLLALDDLQWAGPDALDLLAALLRAGAERPLRVVGAYRSTEVAAAHPLAGLLADLAREGLAADPLALGPLASDEARELVDGLLGEAEVTDREHLTERLLTQGIGIPFYLVSCARAVAQGGLADVEVPWTVRQSLRQRVAALPATAQQLLGLAAVGGRELPRRELLPAAEAALGPDRATLLGAIEAACAAGLLAEDERGDYRLAHDLVREALLADLGAARRAAWHRGWGEALEREPVGGKPERAAELAWHFARGDEPARALPYALAAGDRAEVAYAHTEADRHYGAAAELARAGGDAGGEAGALEKLGDVRYTLGRYVEALQAYEQAAHLYRQAGDWDRYTWSTLLVISCSFAREGQELAEQRLRTLLRTLGSAKEHRRWGSAWDPLRADAAPELCGIAARTASRLCEMTAHCNLRLGRLPDALAAADRALAFARTAGDGQREAAVQVVRGLVLCDGRALDGGVRPDEALAAWAEAGRLAQAAGDLHRMQMALGNCASLQSERGAIEEALRLCASMLPIAERWGAPADVAFAHAEFGVALVAAGRWAEAHAHFEAAQALTATLPPSSEHALAAVLRAWLARLQGRAEAPGLIDRAFALARQFDHEADLLLYLVEALAEADLLAGRDEAARARVEPLLAADEGLILFGPVSVQAALMPLLAWASGDRGDVREADRLLGEAIERTRRVGYRPALADALRVQALLATRQGRWPEAEAALEESLALCRVMPSPYAEAKALYVYGQLHAARGEPERGRERFEQALAILGRLGERLYAAQIERALAELAAPGQEPAGAKRPSDPT